MASQIVILKSRFDFVVFKSNSLTHVSGVFVHKNISHENEWDTKHSLHLGDAHSGEASGLLRNNRITYVGALVFDGFHKGNPTDSLITIPYTIGLLMQILV